MIKAGVLQESIAEASLEYQTSHLGNAITIAGPRLTLPILGTVPADGSVKALSNNLGAAPYIDAADFAVKITDDSLELANILKGDIIYISKQSRAKTGDLALVDISSHVVLRFLKKSGKISAFAAANEKIADITSDNFEIIGVKVAVLRQ